MSDELPPELEASIERAGRIASFEEALARKLGLDPKIVIAGGVIVTILRNDNQRTEITVQVQVPAQEVIDLAVEHGVI